MLPDLQFKIANPNLVQALPIGCLAAKESIFPYVYPSIFIKIINNFRFSFLINLTLIAQLSFYIFIIFYLLSFVQDFASVSTHVSLPRAKHIVITHTDFVCKVAVCRGVKRVQYARFTPRQTNLMTDRVGITTFWGN